MKKEYPYLSQRKLESSVGMHMLGYGPNSGLENALKDGFAIVDVESMETEIEENKIQLGKNMSIIDTIINPHSGSDFETVLEETEDAKILNEIRTRLETEKQLKIADIDTIVSLASEKNLVSCVCTSNPQISAAIAYLNPDIISIEPPELIGTGVAVSKAKPEDITKTLLLVRKVNTKAIVLCGAGISRGEDVAVALKLRTQGVLAASAIVKAKDPYTVLRDFADATKQWQRDRKP